MRTSLVPAYKPGRGTFVPLLVGIAAGLVLAGCGGGAGGTTASVSPTDAKQIARVIIAVNATPDPSVCHRLVTAHYVSEVGGPARCRKLIASNTERTVGVTNITIDAAGNRALATGTYPDGLAYTYALVKEGAVWKLDGQKRIR